MYKKCHGRKQEGTCLTYSYSVKTGVQQKGDQPPEEQRG